MAVDNTFEKSPHDILVERQTGIPQEPEKKQILIDPNAKEQPRSNVVFRSLDSIDPNSLKTANIYTDEALAAGYGGSKYDEDVHFTPNVDLEQERAERQGFFAKIGTGLLKGGTTAVSTALNTTLGVVWGLGSALYELAANEDANASVLDAGVNNWLSQQFMKMQDWSEEAFPNYRTQEERTEEYQRGWWKPSHIFTGNFLGDELLKNMGFSIGAMGGGYLWSRGLGWVMRNNLASDIMKGAVVSSEGDAQAYAKYKRAADAIKAGDMVGVNEADILSNLKDASRAINKMESRLQVYGAAIGAMGEGNAEGLMAKKEFLDDLTSRMNTEYQLNYAKAESDVLNSGDRNLVREQAFQNPDGSLRFEKVLTEEGRKQVELIRKYRTDEYFKSLDYAREQADTLASTTFLLNLPILTSSNLIEYGRLLSGGWKTTRGIHAKLRGKVSVGVEGGRVKLSSNLTPKGSLARRTILNTLKNMSSEGAEEILQGYASSGAKAVAESNLASYNHLGYDDESIHTFGEWLSDFTRGGNAYIGDLKNWNEFFLGALTGILGIPGRRWNGGYAEARREAKDQQSISQAAADKLNALVNSEEFQNRWHSYIRHQALDNEMELALQNDDQYAWHTANDRQLISDVMAFANAGRLDDLNQIVAAYGSMTEADAQGIRNAVANESHPDADWTRNKSDAEVVVSVKKRADAMQRAIDKYKEVYEDISSRAPIGSSPEFIDEMVYTALNIDAFEQRFAQLFDEVMTSIEPELERLARRNSKSEEEFKEKFNLLKSEYNRDFGRNIVSPEYIGDIPSMREASLDDLEELVGSKKELLDKVQDMRKLSDERAAMYRKLQTLMEEDGETKYNEAAVTPQKIEDAAENAFAAHQTEGLDSFEKVRSAYNEKDAKAKAEFMSNLSRVEDANPAVKQFLQFKRKFDAFKAYMDKTGYVSANPAVKPNMVLSAINDLFRRARNEEELNTLPDSVFASLDEFINAYRNAVALTFPDASLYEAVKKVVRDAMASYLTLESDTASRKTISPTPVEYKPDPSTVETPTGYDASQPGSVAPAPVAEEKLPEAEKPVVDESPTVALSNFIKGKTTVTVSEIQREFGWNYKQTMDTIDALIDSGHLERTVSETGRIEYLVKEIPTTKEATETAQEEAVISEPVPEQEMDDILVAKEDSEQEKMAEMTIHEDFFTGVIEYYRCSVPEISTEEARKARDAQRIGDYEAYKKADLSDFLTYLDNKAQSLEIQIDVERNELKYAVGARKVELEGIIADLTAQYEKVKKDRVGYERTWNALKDRDAFGNVTRLKVGDTVEFVIDPTFPTWDGKPQILITTMVNGERKTLTLLSGQRSLYSGLKDLRYTIEKEYSEFAKTHPNDLFVFGKKSTVWARRSGLIDYGTQQDEKPILNIQAYDKDAPIVFINRDGNAQVVHGRDKEAGKKISDTFHKPENNLTLNEKKENKVGRLYYLARTSNGRYEYAPIRLGVEHFKESNKDSDIPTFNKIKDILGEITTIVQESDNLNLEAQNTKLREQLKELRKYLDIHTDFFQIGEYPNVGVALRHNSGGKEATLRRNNQITTDWLVDFIASLDRPIQIDVNNPGRIESLVNEGLITSNVRMLRTKGEDFYIYPWREDKQDFIHSNDVQKMNVDTTKSQNVQIPTTPPARFIDNTDGVPIKEAPKPRTVEDDDSLQKEAGNNNEEVLMGNEYENPIIKNTQLRFSEHREEIQKAILAKGYTEESFDQLSEVLKERVLTCLGV